jgi:AAA15 family ATPase/GTPase
MEFYSGSFQNSKSARKELIESLKLFIPDAEDLEISTGIIPSQNHLIIWRKGFDTPFLINFFGEGTNKILRALLEIKKCKDDKLMIDEIDCGIHFSKIKKFFTILFNAATVDNVQMFAATHSKECIESFTQALIETKLQNEGRIIRLAETKAGIKAYTMRFEEFENALLAESEIR